MFARGRPQVSPTDTHINFGRAVVFSADLCYNGSSKKAFLREEGGTRQGFPEANEMSFGGSLRSVTEGARVTLVFNKFYRNALSLTRLRRELPPGGSLWFVRPESPSIFLTSTAFADTKAKPRARRGDDYFNCSKIALNSLVFLIASNPFSASHTSRTL